jgi:hypothetical protein
MSFPLDSFPRRIAGRFVGKGPRYSDYHGALVAVPNDKQRKAWDARKSAERSMVHLGDSSDQYERPALLPPRADYRKHEYGRTGTLAEAKRAYEQSKTFARVGDSLADALEKSNSLGQTLAVLTFVYDHPFIQAVNRTFLDTLFGGPLPGWYTDMVYGFKNNANPERSSSLEDCVKKALQFVKTPADASEVLRVIMSLRRRGADWPVEHLQGTVARDVVKYGLATAPSDDPAHQELRAEAKALGFAVDRM